MFDNDGAVDQGGFLSYASEHAKLAEKKLPMIGKKLCKEILSAIKISDAGNAELLLCVGLLSVFLLVLPHYVCLHMNVIYTNSS